MRRKIIMISGLIVFTLGLLCLNLGGAFAEEPLKGTSIRVLTFRDPLIDAVKKMAPEFTKTTGIKVIIDDFPYEELAEKIAIELVAGTGKYDLMTVDEPWVPQFAQLFIPFKEWRGSDSVNLSDFLGAALKGGTWKGILYGFPFNGNVYMPLYRKDLFDDPKNKADFKAKYGYELQPPQTMEQLLDTVRFFYRPPKLYGWVSHPKVGEGVVCDFVGFLHAWGGRVLDENMRPVVNSKAAIKALKFFKELLKAGPPGIESYGHAEKIALINSGKVAIGLEWPAIIPLHENPKESVVAGKLGFFVMPKGPVRRAAVTGTWTLNIPEVAKNKDGAAKFSYWLGSYEVGKQLVKAGMSPIRYDLLKDPELSKTHPWYQAQLENFEVGVNRPRIPQYSQVSDTLSLYLHKAIIGEMSVESALNKANKELTKLMKRYGYIK